MAGSDPINVFLNEASKTAEARVQIIREMWAMLRGDQQVALQRSLCVYDRNILNRDLDGSY